jgi:hypothetical protein
MAWLWLATTLRLAPISELRAASELIVHAQVWNVDEQASGFQTAVALKVMQTLKGICDDTLTLLLPGGRSGGRTLRIPGMPIFAAGDEVVLLLERTAVGWALTGLGQGVYRVDRNMDARGATVGQPFAGGEGVASMPFDELMRMLSQ